MAMLTDTIRRSSRRVANNGSAITMNAT